jgi:hypothetical protein
MTPVDPTTDDRGYEHHPAWGMIGASRVQGTGTTLFDSDIQHQHYVTVRISTAMRKRDLNHDWLGTDKQLIEIEMSEAQWASFVSSMNAGQGVPCTIHSQGYERVPEVPYEPRLAESMNEVHGATEQSIEKIKAAFEAYREKKTVGNLRTLQFAIENAPANMEYAASSLTKHAENVVQRARADIEAIVLAKAEQIGIDPGDLTELPQLAPGQE